METGITLNQLRVAFPEDTVWGFNRSEITGFSISKGLHFTIEDAVCSLINGGEYLLTIYKIDTKRHKWLPTLNREYPIKYFGFDKIVFQEWIRICDIPNKIDFDNMNTLKKLELCKQ